MGQRPSQDQASSPYPWSQRRLNFTVTHSNPFPRYGAAVNASASKDGSIYLMGGLINGSTVKGDLWMVEAGPQASGSMTCFPVATTSEGPGPRVGHASLLVGNAFIVFGGDTKMDEGDMLDDTLYLLNTCKCMCKLFSAIVFLIVRSYQAVVESLARWTETARSLWPHPEHTGQQNLHLWWSSRRILL